MTPKDAYVASRLNEVQNAVERATAWGHADPELAAYLAGYLVVMISGVYEDCVERLVLTRAKKAGDKELASLVESRVGQSFRNPNNDKIADLLKEFSPAYRDRYRQRVDSSAKTALDSIVSNKNWLAHGETSKFQVNIRDVEDYYARSKVVIEVVEEILG